MSHDGFLKMLQKLKPIKHFSHLDTLKWLKMIIFAVSMASHPTSAPVNWSKDRLQGRLSWFAR